MLIENIKEALRNLLANKTRSFLTMLGIIIGISAVITITTIGSSIKSTLSATMNSLGGNSISISLDAQYPEDDADWDTWEYPTLDPEDQLTAQMFSDLREQYPDQIMGYIMNNDVGDARAEKSADIYHNVYIQGSTEVQLDYAHLDLIRGRNITSADIEGAKRVAVISDRMAHYYFEDEDPIGQQIELETSSYGNIRVTVVGVYEYATTSFGWEDTSIPEKDRSTYMFIPVSTAMSITGAEDMGWQYSTILLQIGADPTYCQQIIEDYFNNIYDNNPDWQIYVYNMSSEMGTINSVITGITIAISCIAAISLIVGGVGVMNIMLVSVTERTREIGIRKAMGARNKVIGQQFLIESVVLCVIGSIIGIILGLILGIALGKVAEVLVNNFASGMSDYLILKIRPSAAAIGLSVGFSMLIGVFFGSYPAKKAAALEVIDALRYE